MSVSCSNHGLYSDARFSPVIFCRQLRSMVPDSKSPVLFLCIGSDRITGDCLGPLVGHRLSMCNLTDCVILGTLSHPVHAGNLSQAMETIRKDYPEYFVVAIDAALDSQETIGQIYLHNHPLSPGAGVQKLLPPAGEVSITGVVAPLEPFSTAVLSETRLSVVMQMADCIVEGVLFWMMVRELGKYLRRFGAARVSIPHLLLH